MKAIKHQISSRQITGFLVLVILVGFGIQWVDDSIEMTNQVRFMDFTISTLILLAGAKFVSELK